MHYNICCVQKLRKNFKILISSMESKNFCSKSLISSDEPQSESIEAQPNIAFYAGRDKFRKVNEPQRNAGKSIFAAKKDFRKEDRDVKGKADSFSSSIVRRIDPTVWKNMSQEKRDKYLKLKRKMHKLLDSDSCVNDDKDSRKALEANCVFHFTQLHKGDVC